MEYKKQDFIKSNGRRLINSGPRAAQERLKRLQEAESLNDLLHKQVEDLSKELLNSRLDNGALGCEDVNAIVVVEVNKAISELSSKHKMELETLKTLLEEKDKIIRQKDDIINMLGSIGYREPTKVDKSVPEIGTHFVDPDEGKQSFESHLANKEEVGVSSVDLKKTVDKLKNLGIRR